MARKQKTKKSAGRKGRPTPELRRRDPGREPKRVFVISLEDEKSARDYFQAIASQQRQRISVRFAKHLGTDPENVVEAARLTAEAEGPDETWCVFDTEGPGHPARRAQALRAMERARALKFECAVSNPCWEFWLLLHFQNSERAYGDCKAVASDLKEHLPKYHKGVPCFDDLEKGIAEAIARAERIFRTRCDALELGPIDCNPCTQAYLLVRRLLPADEG